MWAEARTSDKGGCHLNSFQRSKRFGASRHLNVIFREHLAGGHLRSARLGYGREVVVCVVGAATSGSRTHWGCNVNL